MSVLLAKQRVSVSEPPFVGLRGNVCNSSLASWKARSRLTIGHNCTFLALTTKALMRRNRPLLQGWVHLGRHEIYKNSVSSVEARMGTEGQIMCIEQCTFQMSSVAFLGHQNTPK